MKAMEARWAEGEEDLFAWTVVGPFSLEDSVGLLVQHPSRPWFRAIYYDKKVESLRSVQVIDGKVVRSGMLEGQSAPA